jgi:hypothetical protein
MNILYRLWLFPRKRSFDLAFYLCIPEPYLSRPTVCVTRAGAGVDNV